MRISPITWWSWSFEQWTWYSDATYMYVVFWVDWNWEAIRDTRDLLTHTSTWKQNWTKPTTLVEVQNLTYN